MIEILVNVGWDSELRQLEFAVLRADYLETTWVVLNTPSWIEGLGFSHVIHETLEPGLRSWVEFSDVGT